MTIDEVQSLVCIESAENLTATNDHRIKLEQAIIPPQRISVIWRKVQNGHLKDEELSVWLVGQENLTDGYKIIMRDDGKQFGLASSSFPNDKHQVLVGWYGSLLSAFLAM
jgi:hypothetical protein